MGQKSRFWAAVPHSPHVRAVQDSSSKMRFLAHFLHFLFLSSSPLFHVRNPSSQNLDFLHFYQQLHHGSCIKDGEQERVDISNRLKFEIVEDSSQSLLFLLESWGRSPYSLSIFAFMDGIMEFCVYTNKIYSFEHIMSNLRIEGLEFEMFEFILVG